MTQRRRAEWVLIALNDSISDHAAPLKRRSISRTFSLLHMGTFSISIQFCELTSLADDRAALIQLLNIDYYINTVATC